MRILTFQGKFNYGNNETFEGFICWCHFEKKDNHFTLEKVTQKLIYLSESQRIILVPFAHLHEDVADPLIAEGLFKKLNILINKQKTDTAVVPFGVTKELHMDILADDSLIKFLNF